jgi:Mn2+/Fe2+ NRAMP family transporter
MSGEEQPGNVRAGSFARSIAIWGPGLLVMLADTDAGNVVTAAQAGAQWGYRLLPLVLALIPMLYVVQELTVRLGVYTGRCQANSSANGSELAGPMFRLSGWRRRSSARSSPSSPASRASASCLVCHAA